jgi:hypothetical protein
MGKTTWRPMFTAAELAAMAEAPAEHAEKVREMAAQVERVTGRRPDVVRFGGGTYRVPLAALLVLLCVGCGEGAGDAGPAACVDEPGLAPCCDQTPLVAEDCPEGTTFEAEAYADGSGAWCEHADGLASPYVTADLDGAVSMRREGDAFTYCDIGTGRAAAEARQGCVVTCYGDCPPTVASLPACN